MSIEKHSDFVISKLHFAIFTCITLSSECLSSGPIHSSSNTPSVNFRFNIAINFSRLGTDSLFSSQPGVATGQPPKLSITSRTGSSSIISICAKLSVGDINI